MKNFQEIYKSEYASEKAQIIDKSSDWEILDNPIMAFVRGVSEDRIKQVLLNNEWTPSEVTVLLREARQARDSAKKN